MPNSASPDDELDAVSEAPVGAMEVRLLDLKWPSRPGVIITDVKSFGCGFGSEFVYCYTFPIHIENAQLKNEQKFRIKVGKADRDPIDRICYQIGGNKTATPEFAQVLLIFQTLASGHLERWLHQRLERAAGASGSEWFITNPDELVRLFREYLRDASCSHDVPSQESNDQLRQPRKKVKRDAVKGKRVDAPLSTRALKWNAISDAADGATPNELVAQFGESDAAWRLGKLVNRGDWTIPGAPPAPYPGKDAGSSAHRAYGRAIIVACGNNKITVVKKFRSRRG